MSGSRRTKKTGFVAVEVAAVVAVIALLLALGFMLYRGMRLAAHASVAENNLKQVSTGMELYFRQYSSYPPEDSDLTVELAPFVENPEVFENPLLDEEAPGETINKLYRQPTLEELDRPDQYITAMVSDNGKTAVILKTNSKVEREDDLLFDPDAPAEELLAVLDPDLGEEEDAPDAPAEPVEEEAGFDFHDDGEVETRTCSDLRIFIVGSQFGYEDGSLVDVVTEADLGDGWFDLFNGQPVRAGDEFTRDSVPAGTRVVVKGEIAGAYERWLWSYYGYPLSYRSTDGTGQVLTLQRGDTPVYFEPGFPCQAPVGELLAPYVDPQTGTVTIAENEALWLWDFNPLETEYGIDFQDLIVLATATVAERECEEDDEGGGSEPPSEDPEPVLAIASDGVSEGEIEDTTSSVEYVVERDEDNTIKFEDAPVGLGEDGAHQTDEFVISVEGDVTSVKVKTKAATGTATNDVPLGGSVTDTLGFRTSLEPLGGGQYKLSVTSVSNRHALSHVEFEFEGGEVVGPDGPYAATRREEATVPSSYTATAVITNTASDPQDAAADVQLGIQVVEGASHVEAIQCQTDVGSVPSGESHSVDITVTTKPSWQTAFGEHIRVRVTIENEANDPDVNEGKSVTFTFDGPEG
ncbi:MAG: hypothetical protein ACLF0G_04490 [Candidatus Brocadiia bacterium]